ncbi:MAG: VWA domain-containing protein [Chloroflexota bacterium]|nr:MAG: VWA domain-containing protein [Chloroflexota bacterium]
MKTRRLLASIFVLSLVTLSLFFPSPARADGIIIPEPPICDPGPCPPFPVEQLSIRYHHVTVTIEDQVAVTHVDQVFYNPNDWQIEGTYMFPIPLDAAVSSFTLWVDGQPVEGKVLDAQQARQTYEEIVRGLRDPALLEYAGRGAVQARIFPIPPQGERRVELEYTQALAAENGLVRYVYPLSTEKFSVTPLENVSISVDVRSQAPIRAVYSPSHEVDISQDGDRHVTAGYEASNVLPDTDFALYYSTGEEQAFHLLTYRDPGDLTDPDGFFMLLLAPRPDAGSQTFPKDVLLVLDRSGSMDGEKFQQAQEALRYILRHLNPEDRFNIITFSTGVEYYASGLRPASEANEALPWVDRLSAQGSTDINRALLEAASMADRERPTYLIFLTDGLPTEGVVESQQILNNLSSGAPASLRLFAFGVGYDVDTFLLDSLAQEHHGASQYVLPGERLDESLSGFYAKISTPVLTNLSLDYGDMPVYDVYPNPLPDLFIGSQIIVVGRYRDGGPVTVTLTGDVNGEIETFRYDDQRFETESSRLSSTLSALPRLWATRKIGYLLNQIRLEGADQETIDQIVRLSVRYGIVTPYTSYLVTEVMPLGADEMDRIAEEEYNNMLEAPAAEVYGQEAVEKAVEQGAMSAADAASAPPAEASEQVRIVGSRTFVRVDGVWVDTGFDPGQMQTTRVAFLSDDYFALAQASPDLAAAFALGERVIALSDGAAYEVVASDASTEPVEIPATNTPVPDDDPDSPAPAPVSSTKPGQAPCLGGLLPLILLALVYRLASIYRGEIHI